MKNKYILIRGQLSQISGDITCCGAFRILGVYDNEETLKNDYKAQQKIIDNDFKESLEYIDRRSVFARKENFDKLYIFEYNEKSGEWDMAHKK